MLSPIPEDNREELYNLTHVDKVNYMKVQYLQRSHNNRLHLNGNVCFLTNSTNNHDYLGSEKKALINNKNSDGKLLKKPSCCSGLCKYLRKKLTTLLTCFLYCEIPEHSKNVSPTIVRVSEPRYNLTLERQKNTLKILHCKLDHMPDSLTPQRRGNVNAFLLGKLKVSIEEPRYSPYRKEWINELIFDYRRLFLGRLPKEHPFVIEHKMKKYSRRITGSYSEIMAWHTKRLRANHVYLVMHHLNSKS